MKTLLSIKVDREVKEEAQHIASDLGLPLSTLINAQLKQLVRDREVSLVSVPRMTPSLERLLEGVEEDLRLGKKMVGPLKTEKEVLSYLDSL